MPPHRKKALTHNTVSGRLWPMRPPTCAHLDCPNEPTHQQPVQTALMQQPVYYLVCAEHADGLLDPEDPYSYADVTIGQTQHAEG